MSRRERERGVALVAMNKLRARGDIKAGDKVVVVSTAHGLKFTDFKLRYHQMETEGVVPQLPNPPIELEARYDVVRDSLLREIDTRFGR